nr:uncharacterized protein LOC127320997 isoform X1 [Lolium perenne]
MPPSPWTAARLAGQQKRTALISSSPSSASRNLGRQELLEIFHVYTVYVPATSMSSTPATSSASPSSSSSTPGYKMTTLARLPFRLGLGRVMDVTGYLQDS